MSRTINAYLSVTVTKVVQVRQCLMRDSHLHPSFPFHCPSTTSSPSPRPLTVLPLLFFTPCISFFPLLSFFFFCWFCLYSFLFLFSFLTPFPSHFLVFFRFYFLPRNQINSIYFLLSFLSLLSQILTHLISFHFLFLYWK